MILLVSCYIWSWYAIRDKTVVNSSVVYCPFPTKYQISFYTRLGEVGRHDILFNFNVFHYENNEETPVSLSYVLYYGYIPILLWLVYLLNFCLPPCPLWKSFSGTPRPASTALGRGKDAVRTPLLLTMVLINGIYRCVLGIDQLQTLIDIICFLTVLLFPVLLKGALWLSWLLSGDGSRCDGWENLLILTRGFAKQLVLIQYIHTYCFQVFLSFFFYLFRIEQVSL